MKRAAIYIRVSSERQVKNNDVEKASPKAQEADCREWCQRNNYMVVEVYRDIAKYRIGKRMVEPSGTRADRPGFKAMIRDAYDQKIDVIVAWREDRLYRSFRPMLDFLDCHEKANILVELVKESWDSKLAPVKAWAAKMELAARHDRHMMGIEYRLRDNKVLGQRPPYGYKKVDTTYEIDPEEAYWLRNIFEWYADGLSITKIRQRLIDGGAVQKRGKDPKYPWAIPAMYKLLKYKPYWNGKQVYNWNGESFEVNIPMIIDPEVAQRVAMRLEEYRSYAAGNFKSRALAGGLAYCASCKVKMVVSSNGNGKTMENGKLKVYQNYQCGYRYKATYNDECAGRISVDKLDKQIWDKVWMINSEPGMLEEALQARIDDLQSQTVDADEKYRETSNRLDSIFLRRQAVIGFASRGVITEDDLQTQLLTLSIEQRELQKKMSEAQLLIQTKAEGLQELVEVYRERYSLSMAGINDPAPTAELEVQRLEAQRKIVRSIVERVDVYADKTCKVHFMIDLPALVEADSIVCISSELSDSSSRSRRPGGR